MVDKQPQPHHLSAQQTYQAVFQLIEDAIVIVNRDQQIVYLNPAGEKLLGLPQDKAVRQSLSAVMRNQHQIEWTPDTPPNTPLALAYKDEQLRYAVQRKPLPEQAGTMWLFKDVTEHRQAQDDLKRLLSEYSNYAHTVGHDVKSPLGVVIGYSNMLQSELDAGSEARFFADEIFNVSMRIMYICNELVVLGELRNLKTLDLNPVNLKLTVETVNRHFTRNLTERNVTLNTPETLPLVRGNALWLDEVMVNFVHHALQHCDNDTEIHIRALPQGDHIRVQVTHDGQALSRDEQASLFDLSIPLENIRAEGNGLGMGVARRLIERLGGLVGIANAHTVYFSLPADAAQ